MDSLLPQLLAFPPHPKPAIPLSDADYDKQIKTLLHTLNTVSANKLTSSVPGGGDLLDILDPSVNTLPYLFSLLAQIGALNGKSNCLNPGATQWQKALYFLERFDPIQIRYAGIEIRRLFDIVASKLPSLKSDTTSQAEAFSALGTAILRVDPAGATFTSSHLIFLRKCLEEEMYSEALPVLNHTIFYFPSTKKSAEHSLHSYLCSNHDTSSTFISAESSLSAKLDYRDHLEYFLYGAMCYMGLKEWRRALLLLEIVIVCPVVVNASKIQVEAYKKYILVGLLYRGQQMEIPKTTPTAVSRQCRAIVKAYEGLAEVFQNSLEAEESSQRLIREANAGRVHFWGPDCNSGLVGQVIDAFRQFSVLRLEKTFAALTVADITRRTSPDPNDYAGTGTYLINLVSSGKLNATISEPSEDPASWIIRFPDETSGPLARTQEQQYEALAKQTQKIQSLMAHIKETDRKLSLSNEYIRDAKKKRKEKAETGENGDSFQTSGMDGFDQDEDMMADMLI